MSKKEVLDNLISVTESAQAIEANLAPFLKILQNENEDDSTRSNDASRHAKAEAQAAVALTLGTLRYMNAKLRGSDCSENPNHPLRLELDKMRQAIVALTQVDTRTKSQQPSNQNSQSSPPPKNASMKANKKRRISESSRLLKIE